MLSDQCSMFVLFHRSCISSEGPEPAASRKSEASGEHHGFHNPKRAVGSCQCLLITAIDSSELPECHRRTGCQAINNCHARPRGGSDGTCCSSSGECKLCGNYCTTPHAEVMKVLPFLPPASCIKVWLWCLT